MKYVSSLLLLSFLVLGSSVFGQEKTDTWFGIDYGLSGSNYQPFWLRSNQYGLVPVKGSFTSVNAGYIEPYKTNKKYAIGYGAEARFLVGTDASALLLPELYVKGKLGFLEIWGGRRKQVFGLVDSTLSSGSFAWSGNALPMPKVELIVPDWHYPKIFKGVLAFKGSFAHGWFDNNRNDVAHIYLHQKSFYGQIGRSESRLKLFGGFTHQVQWGGKLLYDDPKNIYGFNGYVPSDLKAYFYVVTGFTLGSNSANTQSYGINDAWNRAGNHLGTVDLGAELKIGKVNVLGYRQSYYDDGSLFWLNNITDGLNGISIHSKSKSAFRKLVLEYFNSTSQGGPIDAAAAKHPWERGMDNYFNNSVYTEGWTYNKTGIGSPFITLDSETELNPTKKIYFDNNRVEAFYIASEWKIGEANVIFKGSLANAIGWFKKEYVPVKKMYSFALMVEKPIYFLGFPAQLTTKAGYDHSEWYPNIFALHLGIKTALFK